MGSNGLNQVQGRLFYVSDCDGSDSALLLVGLERLGRGFGHRSVGSSSVPHSYETGRHTEKLTSKPLNLSVVVLSAFNKPLY